MNRRKSAKPLAKLHYRISCQRADFLHKATSDLTTTNSTIVVEDLNVGGMLKNHCLARSISDAGWSEFVRQLEYKASWNGGSVVKAGRFYPSTKTCSACGMVKDEMSLSERTYHCDGCGLVLDRDVNAARKLLSLSSASSARFQACGDSPLGGSVKQEPSVMNNE
jgi:putative transposase